MIWGYQLCVADMQPAFACEKRPFSLQFLLQTVDGHTTDNLQKQENAVKRRKERKK